MTKKKLAIRSRMRDTPRFIHEFGHLYCAFYYKNIGQYSFSGNYFLRMKEVEFIISERADTQIMKSHKDIV